MSELAAYTFEHVRWGAPRRTALWLAPEPELSAVSDDYDEDIDPREMFAVWVTRVRRRGKFHDAMGEPWIGIYWSVRGEGVMETAPFQRVGTEDFLTHFTWPIDDRGERLDWLSLPVRMGAKSAFVEHATGWLPGALLPVVNLDLLEFAYDRGAAA